MQNMTEKDKILEAWIMVEHLSEGDISLRDKSVLTLDDLHGQDFYSLFFLEMQKKKFTSRQKGGFVVYFDIFSFQEVVSILREQYRLKPTEEEIRSGNKFSFALYFDRNFHFLQDMTFFTESAYIRYYKKVPRENEFRDFEDRLKKQFSQDFDETSEAPDQFNAAMQKELLRYGIDIKNCRMQILKNIETEATNLHSFFIDDLEKAKKIDTDHLNAYLYGNQERRINLDSKKESVNFNPRAFEQILQPKNYPLGRFPGNTAYALSLMQQVAVNLSVGYDSRQMRSVNGPPGTGKTTLLKDIFAQLVVQQAYDIAKLSDHLIRGTEETVYYEHASIGVIPAYISENNIVVASSNNGAVQNIVNELPLRKEIDEALIGELEQADYFYEISNAKLSAEWKEDESGKRQEELVMEAGQGEEKFWGTFSLEGGKSDNMTNILTNIKHIHKELEEAYVPDPDIYKQFLKQYEEAAAVRAEAQAFADSIRAFQDSVQKLEQARISYRRESGEKERRLYAELQRLGETGQECRRRLEQLYPCLEAAKSRTETAQKSRNSLELCLQAHMGQKPGFFAGRKEKEEYRSRLNEITDELLGLKEEDQECSRQEQEINNDISVCRLKLMQSTEKQEELQKKFDGWKRAEEDKISALEKKIREYERIRDCGAKPLDMNQDYDDLQLSNPWFDESYRIAQSKLFIAALRVRKQFLYENRKNIRAAFIIWNQPEKYLDQKPVIEAAWNWINMTIPVISSTFASFSRMCRHLGPETLGHLFIDEAGQALPQAAVGAVCRSRHVMVVGDPSQIKPVLTLDSSTLSMLGSCFGVTEKYLSAAASAQTLVDAASQYGFYRKQDRSGDSWIGIPLWVHRRCQYPMFTISNVISYDGFMVQGMKNNGKTGWFDIGGKANNKYVKEQGEFLLQKIRKMMEQNPKIADKKEKDVIYVITPFSNVAYQLSQKLRSINFTRYDAPGRPTNVGTVHTFQGKEAPIVFFVLGADSQSSGAARWAVSEPNMMNVAATRAKKEFYIIGDKKLYLGLGCDVATDTDRIIRQYKKQYPDLVDDEVMPVTAEKAERFPEASRAQTGQTQRKAPRVPTAEVQALRVSEVSAEVQTSRVSEVFAEVQTSRVSEPSAGRVTGTVKYVGKGRRSFYAYVDGDDKKEYSIPESIYSGTDRADEVIQKGNRISFVPEEGKKKPLATDVKTAAAPR